MENPELSHWEGEAEDYSQKRKPSDADKRVLETINYKAKMSIAELGIGSAVFTGQLLQQYGDDISYYTGIDFVEYFLECGKQTLSNYPLVNSKFIHGDLMNIDLPANIYDTAFCISTIHHIPPDSMIKVFEKVFNSLNLGGQLLLCEDWAFSPDTKTEEALVYLRKQLQNRSNRIEYHLSTQKYCELLRSAGFDIYREVWGMREVDLSRYASLTDDVSKSYVNYLNSQSEPILLRMIILDARKREV